jgi:hypothetical protein
LSKVLEFKLARLSDAIDRFVPKGTAGRALETLIPFAAGQEVNHQGKQTPTLIFTISDILYDQIIEAGGVGKTRGVRAGNVLTGFCCYFRLALKIATIGNERSFQLYPGRVP